MRFVVLLFCMNLALAGCSDKGSPSPPDGGSGGEVTDATKVTDASPGADTGTIGDSVKGPDTNTEENPCVLGYTPSFQLGELEGDKSFTPFEAGDPIPFEFGSQGGSMIVVDMLHRGTAGLDGSVTVQVFNADTGANLINFEQPIMGTLEGEEGQEDPMWMCVDGLGNVVPDLWLSSWEDLPNDQNVLIQGYASFSTGPDSQPLVLSFEVEGPLTYTP